MTSLKQVNLATYYPSSANVNLEGLHPYQCFIYGVVLSLLSKEKTPLVLKVGKLSELFMHGELTCICALKTLHARNLINLNFESGSAYITNIEKQEGVA